MKKRLQILALVIGVLAAVSWFVLGANRGWTRTTVPVKTLDEVTGLEGIQYKKQFVPGLEFLGGAIVAAAFVAASSFLFPQSTNNKNK